MAKKKTKTKTIEELTAEHGPIAPQPLSVQAEKLETAITETANLLANGNLPPVDKATKSKLLANMKARYEVVLAEIANGAE